jgi:hypothetical protein
LRPLKSGPILHFQRWSGVTLQGSAIVEVRVPRADCKSWLCGIGVRQVRLGCGLVMFAYICSHFFNHVLGNISHGAMEAWMT